MANDPQLASPTQLIDAFLKDLQGIFGLFRTSGGGAGAAAVAATRIVCITQTNSVTGTWVTDADCYLRGVLFCTSGSSDLVLSTDNTSAGGTGVFQAATKTYVGGILGIAKALAGNLLTSEQRTFLGKGQKVYFNNQSVNGAQALLILENVV